MILILTISTIFNFKFYKLIKFYTIFKNFFITKILKF